MTLSAISGDARAALRWALALLIIALPLSTVARADDDLEQKIIQYREKLAEYTKARTAYEELASPYWSAIGEKRTRRLKALRAREEPALEDYVIEQPPLYTGPPKPQDPEKPREPPEYVPVVADFLKNAEEQFNFTPQRPASDDEYRRAYAKRLWLRA